MAKEEVVRHAEIEEKANQIAEGIAETALKDASGEASKEINEYLDPVLHHLVSTTLHSAT
jgi:uncharacterized phage infection (PIP) family protein YhgE